MCLRMVSTKVLAVHPYSRMRACGLIRRRKGSAVQPHGRRVKHMAWRVPATTAAWGPWAGRAGAPSAPFRSSVAVRRAGFPRLLPPLSGVSIPTGRLCPPHPGVLLTFSVGVLAMGTLLAGSPGCSGSLGPPHLHCDSPLWPTGSPPWRDAGSVTSTSGSSALQRFGSRSDDAFLPASPGPKLALRSSDSRHFMVRKAVDSHTGKPLPDT